MKHLGDITKISGYEAPPVDVVIGGSPCQDLSVAGKRAGLAGERSGLFMEQIRLIKEMREHDRNSGRTDVFVRPRFMVWENVPGAFSSNKGEDFRAVLEETARVAQPDAVIPGYEDGWRTSGCILGRGWSIAWRVLDAQFWGVPQRRRRIALVADFGGHAAPEILFVRKGVCGDFETSGETREVAPAGTGTSAYPPVARSLTARYDGSPCIDRGPNIIVAESILPFDTTQITSKLNYSHPRYGDPCHPLAAGANPPAVVFASQNMSEFRQSEVTSTMSARDYKSARDLVSRAGGTVRRLTPLECERLQGFPDGWTDIGEWTDTKGKRHDTSDAARYKALGNSIAIPPWAWVLKRICACYERTATMASLFDGIGGFPLIWERLNGKGSCLWASEIEEFPIAVTKRHFGGFCDDNSSA